MSPNTEFVKKARRFQRKLQEAVPDIDVGYAAFLDDDINNMTIPLSRHKRLEKANSRKLQPQSKDMSSRSISTDLEEEGESSSSEDKQDIQEVLADMDRTDKQTGVGSGNLNTATSKSFMSHAGTHPFFSLSHHYCHSDDDYANTTSFSVFDFKLTDLVLTLYRHLQVRLLHRRRQTDGRRQRRQCHHHRRNHGEQCGTQVSTLPPSLPLCLFITIPMMVMIVLTQAVFLLCPFLFVPSTRSPLPYSALCRRLVRQGAKKIMVCASHGVFSAESMRIIDLSVVDEVVVTDSLPLPKNIHVSKKIRQVSVAPLLAKIIETELFNQMGVVTSGGDDVSGDNDDDNEFEEVS